MTVAEILAIHPAPWRHVLHAQPGTQGGVIHVIDAANQQVQLFTMLDYLMQHTQSIAAGNPA